MKITLGAAIFLLLAAAEVHSSVADSRNTVAILPDAYTKYKDCRAGVEYGVQEHRRDIQEDDISKYHTFINKQGKQKYYYCRACSMCGDGMIQKSACREGDDTKCGGCIDPSHMYDPATKSCQPIVVVLGLEEHIPVGEVLFYERDRPASLSESQHQENGEEKTQEQTNTDNKTPEILGHAVTEDDKNARKEGADCHVEIRTDPRPFSFYVYIASIAFSSFLVAIIVVAILIVIRRCRHQLREKSTSPSQSPV